ncbi:MAG: hypothetical protein E6Q89_07800 [Bacteroidia bacterium]|nr:MAG: hypothetical protein E6Q89_07800 [Bacteroidia bacterium]
MVNKFKYSWLSYGDIGAAATIIFDNLTILTFMSLILQFGYQFPIDVILKHMIPGTVAGVLVGNLFCFWLSFRLAKKEKRNVTAIPLGLDAPSAIGFVLCIIGPAYAMLRQKGLDVNVAGLQAWHIGVGCLFVLGVIKLICSIFAKQAKAMIPQAALLGAIGGVALGLIGFIPLISIFKVPAVGLLSLSIVILSMYARVRLPFNFSGIPVAIVIGTIAYFVLASLGLSGAIPVLHTTIEFMLPMPALNMTGVYNYVISYMALIIPFALLVVVGTMSVTESANCMGDNYKVRDLVLIDAIATICSALFGGVSQTTPYAGFPAYKKLDARAGYLIINIIIVGIGGIFGVVGFIVGLVPESAVAPVLLFVALEIAMQGFVQCDKKYVAPILLAFFPSIARLLQIKLTDGSLIATNVMQANMFMQARTLSDQLVVVILGNGFIITGILWATVFCYAIDRKWVRSFFACMILAILSYFGIIHSLYINGQVYWPTSLPITVRNVPLTISVGYVFMGILILLSAYLHKKKPLTIL